MTQHSLTGVMQANEPLNFGFTLVRFLGLIMKIQVREQSYSPIFPHDSSSLVELHLCGLTS
jgi:hypothetical protein